MVVQVLVPDRFSTIELKKSDRLRRMDLFMLTAKFGHLTVTGEYFLHYYMGSSGPHISFR